MMAMQLLTFDKPRAWLAATGAGRGMALACGILLAALAAGCRSGGGASTGLNPVSPGVAHYAANILTEGDVLNIAFQYSTNFSTMQKIALDGTLNLEGVGQVRAAGRTSLELQDELARLYRPQVREDVITVKVVGATSGIYVSGAVMRPGKVPLERPMTVLEGIMEAGGYDPHRAKLAAVTVLRLEEGRQKTYHLDVSKMLKGEIQEPFYLKPFDIIHVPIKTFNL
jgi:polysaccharide export outer membrane protein